MGAGDNWQYFECIAFFLEQIGNSIISSIQYLQFGIQCCSIFDNCSYLALLFQSDTVLSGFIYIYANLCGKPIHSSAAF